MAAENRKHSRPEESGYARKAAALERAGGMYRISDKEVIEYPYNLFDAIIDETDLTQPPSITMDIRIGISNAISTLGEMEQEILRLRFKEKRIILVLAHPSICLQSEN